MDSDSLRAELWITQSMEMVMDQKAERYTNILSPARISSSVYYTPRQIPPSSIPDINDPDVFDMLHLVVCR